MSDANYEYLQKPNIINCLCLQNKMLQKMCISKLVLNGTWTYIFTFPRILCRKHYKPPIMNGDPFNTERKSRDKTD